MQANCFSANGDSSDMVEGGKMRVDMYRVRKIPSTGKKL